MLTEFEKRGKLESLEGAGKSLGDDNDLKSVPNDLKVACKMLKMADFSRFPKNNRTLFS